MTDLFDIRVPQSFNWFKRPKININNKLDFDVSPIANNWIDDIRINNYIRPIQNSRLIINVEEFEIQREKERGIKVDIQPEKVIEILRTTKVKIKKRDKDGKLILDNLTGEQLWESRTLLEIIQSEDVNKLREVLLLMLNDAHRIIQNNQNILFSQMLSMRSALETFTRLLERFPGFRRRGDSDMMFGIKNILKRQTTSESSIDVRDVNYNEYMSANPTLSILSKIFGNMKDKTRTERNDAIKTFLKIWKLYPHIRLDLTITDPEVLVRGMETMINMGDPDNIRVNYAEYIRNDESLGKIKSLFDQMKTDDDEKKKEEMEKFLQDWKNNPTIKLNMNVDILQDLLDEFDKEMGEEEVQFLPEVEPGSLMYKINQKYFQGTLYSVKNGDYISKNVYDTLFDPESKGEFSDENIFKGILDIILSEQNESIKTFEVMGGNLLSMAQYINEIKIGSTALLFVDENNIKRISTEDLEEIDGATRFQKTTVGIEMEEEAEEEEKGIILEEE